MKVIPETCHAY